MIQQENTDTAYRGYQPIFTKKDKTKTVLIPWFTDFLSPLIPAIAKLAGYHFVNCPKTSKTSAEIGLKYGNNEVCYPATLVLGDLIAEIQTGKYNLDNLAVAISQTGGQCRATNYLGLIKTGLTNAGLGHIPVISISLGSIYQNEQPGFKLPIFKIFNIMMYTFFFGDALNQLHSACIVRERNRGESEQLFNSYMERAEKIILENKYKKLISLIENAVEDYNKIPVFEDKKIEKIGLVGEIFVKYNSYGQAHITEWLRSQGVEADVPPMIDFFMQSFVNRTVNQKNGIIHTGKIMRKLMPLFYRFVSGKMKIFEAIMRKSRFFYPHESIFEIARHAEKIIDLSNQFGEGWMLAGEVASFAERGINKVVCVQPFGCIANHIVAKGIERRIKQLYPKMNLLFLDIDGGMAEVNLQNRLKFLTG